MRHAQRSLIAQPHFQQHVGVTYSGCIEIQNALVIAYQFVQVWLAFDITNTGNFFAAHHQGHFALVVFSIVRNVIRAGVHLCRVCFGQEPSFNRKVDKPTVKFLVLVMRRVKNTFKSVYRLDLVHCFFELFSGDGLVVVKAFQPHALGTFSDAVQRKQVVSFLLPAG